ncbi:MAG TPA: ATP phosphoribosyltransferase regulatory subunit [Thermoanaerobaculia bacterium]|nr:ATP phosphoribosyltransferase regulatory subunit [Thermoanaerobaculia bacterium]
MRKQRASLPAGTAAYVFAEATRRREAEERIAAGLKEAGYLEAMVPSADYLSPYLAHISASEERELYRFVDRHGDTLALRADFTIALARHLSPRLPPNAGSTRMFYRGEVLRGGTRDGVNAEFYQIGAELLGDSSSAADLEIVERCLSALQAGRAGPLFTILSCVGALEVLVAPEAEGEEARRLARAIRERRLADTARMARAASPDFERRVRRLLEGELPPDDALIRRLAPGGETLSRIADSLSGRKDCRVAIDLAEPAPRSYYTGFFFSVYGASGGEPIAGGGRYDDLYGAFGTPRPAVGFSLGLEGIVGS